MRAVANAYVYVSRLFLGVSGGILLFLAFFGALDIVAQFIGMSFAFKLELSEVMLAAMIFLAFPSVHIYGGEISLDILPTSLSGKTRDRLQKAGYLLGACFELALGLFTWKLALESFGIQEVALGYLAFPVYPFKILCAVGISFAALGLILKSAETDIFRPEAAI